MDSNSAFSLKQNRAHGVTEAQQLQMLIDEEFKTSPMFYYIQVVMMIMASMLVIGVGIFLFKQDYNFDISPFGWLCYAVILALNTVLLAVLKKKPTQYYIDFLKKHINLDADSLDRTSNDLGMEPFMTALFCALLYVFYILISRFEYQYIFSIRLSSILLYTAIVYVLVIYGVVVNIIMEAKCINIYNKLKDTSINTNMHLRKIIMFFTTLILSVYITALTQTYDDYTIKPLQTFKTDLANKISARDSKIKELTETYELKKQYDECMKKECTQLQNILTKLGSSADIHTSNLDPSLWIDMQARLKSVLDAANQNKLSAFIGTTLKFQSLDKYENITLEITEDGPIFTVDIGIDRHYALTEKP